MAEQHLPQDLDLTNGVVTAPKLDSYDHKGRIGNTLDRVFARQKVESAFDGSTADIEVVKKRGSETRTYSEEGRTFQIVEIKRIGTKPEDPVNSVIYKDVIEDNGQDKAIVVKTVDVYDEGSTDVDAPKDTKVGVTHFTELNTDARNERDRTTYFLNSSGREVGRARVTENLQGPSGPVVTTETDIVHRDQYGSKTYEKFIEVDAQGNEIEYRELKTTGSGNTKKEEETERSRSTGYVVDSEGISSTGTLLQKNEHRYHRDLESGAETISNDTIERYYDVTGQGREGVLLKKVGDFHSIHPSSMPLPPELQTAEDRANSGSIERSSRIEVYFDYHGSGSFRAVRERSQDGRTDSLYVPSEALLKEHRGEDIADLYPMSRGLDGKSDQGWYFQKTINLDGEDDDEPEAENKSDKEIQPTIEPVPDSLAQAETYQPPAPEDTTSAMDSLREALRETNDETPNTPDIHDL